VNKNKKDSRICIIGAGASGLSMSYYLKKKGYSNIVVLEKNEYIGGKCFSELKYGQASGMGAIAITPDYKNTLKLIKKLDLHIESCPKNTLLDTNDGYQYPLEDLFRGESRAKIFLSVIKYFFYLCVYKRKLKKPGFKKITRSLAQPFSSWLESKNMTNLEKLFCVPITCFGYGYLHEIPAAYAVKYMNFGNFSTLLRIGLADLLGYKPKWTKRLTNSFQNLLKELAKEVPALKLNVDILKINRQKNEGGKVEIAYLEKTSGQENVETYDYLIVSIPQETKELHFMDLTNDEKELFDKVIHFDYYTIACEVKDFSCNFFLQLVNDRKFEIPEKGYPLMVSKVWDESDISVFYSYSNNSIGEDEVVQKMKENVAKINRKIVGISEVKKWNYFPHVNQEDLESGFYEKIEKLQGENNTFYAGSLLNFELVENVISYSRYLSKKFF